MEKGKRQKEFNNMPERTPLGKKAIEFLNIKDSIKSQKDKLDKAKNELIQLFIEAKKASIKIEGYTVLYAHSEKDKITVKQQTT